MFLNSSLLVINHVAEFRLNCFSFVFLSKNWLPYAYYSFTFIYISTRIKGINGLNMNIVSLYNMHISKEERHCYSFVFTKNGLPNAYYYTLI